MNGNLQLTALPDRRHRSFVAVLGVSALLALPQAGMSQTATFENLPLQVNSYWNGSSGSGGTGGFTSGGAYFINEYSNTNQSWQGWSYTNGTVNGAAGNNSGNPGYYFQYDSVTGSGAGGSSTYAVAYANYSVANPDNSPATIILPQPCSVSGAYLTNNTYAYMSMLDGDQFTPAFTSTDSFTVTISASNASNQPTGTPINFELGAGTNLVTSWTWVNMSSLGSNVKAIGFTFSGTENDPVYGLDTPAYVALDDLTMLPPTIAWAGTGSSNNWSAAGNWGGATPTSSQAVAFAVGHGTSQNNLTNAAVSGISFGALAGSYTISGNSILLNGDLTNSSTAAQTITANLVLSDSTGVFAADAGNIILPGNISGDGAIVKTGTGLVALSGSNSYSGVTVVLDGTLEFDGAASLVAGASLTIGGDGDGSSSNLAFGTPTAISTSPAPEPATWLMLMAAVLTFVFIRRFRAGRVYLSAP